MCKNIHMLLRQLDWNGSIESQHYAIAELLKIESEFVVFLVQPMDKNHWENSAKVLKMLGYPKNKLAIQGMLEWLKDLNWPGALTVMETLQDIEASVLVPHLETAVQQALNDEDGMWMMALKELAIYRMHLKKIDFRKKEFYELLEQIGVVMA